MTNQHFMIFQTAVRKYVGIYCMKKVKLAILLLLFTDLKKTIKKNFGQKMRKIFLMLCFFLKIL
jgi:DNA replicative helicase MCM subunit Mcm2 (Cdc46/Mcm family)